MQDHIKIVGMSGSLRKGSFNSALLRLAPQVVPDNAELVLVSLAGIPLYNGDIEDAGMPEPVAEFRAELAAADALLISTPEYNSSVPAVLKNAIDWASRGRDSPLRGMTAALMGGGGGFGSHRSQSHLRDVLRNTGVFELPVPAVKVRNIWDKFDEDLNLLEPRILTQVERLVRSLVSWTLALRYHGR
ncbi:MAG: NAD(P)H-dependent oxidoreductase [bacterium]|nr:NAD(P)H-dependent oxidoreductase [Acidimicrobiia bacterium]MCY4650238.1 NAD(P)H-dependent oxidoreductase [bacterium]